MRATTCMPSRDLCCCEAIHKFVPTRRPTCDAICLRHDSMDALCRISVDTVTSVKCRFSPFSNPTGGVRRGLCVPLHAGRYIWRDGARTTRSPKYCARCAFRHSNGARFGAGALASERHTVAHGHSDHSVAGSLHGPLLHSDSSSLGPTGIRVCCQ